MLNLYLETLKLEFTSPTISTIAYIGLIFKEKLPVNYGLKLNHVMESIDMGVHSNIIYMECEYRNSENKSVYMIRGTKEEAEAVESDEVSASSTPIGEAKVGKCFSNSLTFAVKICENRKPIKVKLSTNGSLQIPGFKDPSELEEFLRQFAIIIDSIPTEIIPKENLDIHIVSISMIKYYFAANVQFNLVALNNFAVSETDMLASYEGNDSKSAELSWKFGDHYVDFTPAYTGKINVTSLYKIDDIGTTYSYITEFIRKNIKNFIMFDRLENLMLILKHNQVIGDQKSEEWHKARAKGIGASEVSSVFDMSYNQSRAAFVREKANTIFSGKRSFYGNEATEFGVKFEPIAIQFYVRRHNMSGASYKIFAYQPSSIRHGKYSCINASPDSIIFALKPGIDLQEGLDLTGATLAYIEKLHADGNIAHFYVLEIKCPKNYKSYYGGMKKMIECVDGHVPSYYWCQVQQQMHVTGATYGVFANNHFNIVSEDGYDKHVGYKGVFYDNGRGKYSYPKRCGVGKYSALEELGEIGNGKIVYWILIDATATNVLWDDTWEVEKVPKIVTCFEEILNVVELLGMGEVY